MEGVMKKLAIGAALLLFAGCSSFRTTAVDRMENDMLVVNPETPLKGIPVSLRVPSHLELSVIETTYWEKKVITGDRPTLQRLSSCRPTRTVLHHVCETEKIFLVDPVRPGAGTESYGFTFRSNTAAGATKDEDAQGKGYLQNVEYKIDDQTITESSKLLANSLNLISALQTSVNNVTKNSADLIATDSAIAFGRFDINSPTFECDVAAFLDSHLNCTEESQCPEVCTDCLKCKPKAQ